MSVYYLPDLQGSGVNDSGGAPHIASSGGKVATIIFLIVFGIVANFLCVFIVNFAGLPGALLAGAPGKRGKGRFIFGSVVCAIGQSFIYLAYAAFIVNWTLLAISHQNASILVWSVAFLTVALPLWFNLIHARLESREQGQANAQVEGLHITMLVALAGFFLFAFFPITMQTAYGWVPYMQQ